MRHYIKGLDCPHCAMGLETYIKQHKHVKYCKLDFAKGIIDIELDDDCYFDELYEDIKKVEPITLTLKESKYTINKILLLRLFISVLFLILGISLNNLIFYIISYLIISIDIVIKAIKNVFKGKLLDERFLMSIASLGAFVIKEYHEACLVMILYRFGEFLQELAVNKSREKIYSLVNLKVEEANVIINEESIVKNVNDIKVNDIIEVRKGEKVALDGILLSNNATFNTQSLTGESNYLELNNNDNVLSGYINEGNVIRIKVNKEYNDSTIKHIMDMIENATNNKTKTENFITKFSKYYTPIVCLTSLLIFMILLILNKEINIALNSALIFLVVSCPCALVLSIPLLYFASIGKCSKEGILVKGSSYLEEASNIKNIIFDKTGTLTTGNFIVKDYSDKETLNIAANLELYSLHPIAKSISKYVNNKLIVSNFNEEKSRGIKANIDNDNYLFGNYKFMLENNINVKNDEDILYLAKNNSYFGYIKISDELKEDIDLTLNNLSKYHLVLLSGDNEKKVKETANKLNIKDYYYSKLPDEKANIIKGYPNSIYVGDGINDSVSLLEANIGVSMGINGSDEAISVSDVVLAKDNINSLLTFIKIANKTKRIAIFNVIFILFFKLLFLVLATFNLIDMSLAVFADVGIALLCVLNSLRILK